MDFNYPYDALSQQYFGPANGICLQLLHILSALQTRFFHRGKQNEQLSDTDLGPYIVPKNISRPDHKTMSESSKFPKS